MAAYQYVYVMDKLSKTYAGGKQVLKEVRLSFFPGAKIGIVGVNVVVYCDDHFAARTQQGGGAIQSAPNFGLRHLSIDHNGDHLAQVGQRFVHDHFFHTLDAHGLAQVIQEDGF